MVVDLRVEVAMSSCPLGTGTIDQAGVRHAEADDQVVVHHAEATYVPVLCRLPRRDCWVEGDHQ